MNSPKTGLSKIKLKKVSIKREKLRESVRNNNMKYLELTSLQLDDHEKLMQMPMGQWPNDLKEFMKQYVGQPVCGDAMSWWVAEFVRFKTRKDRKRYLRP